MKIAILSVSEKGKILSSKLKSLLSKDPTVIWIDAFHKNVKENIDNIFIDNVNNPVKYDAIIGIMATGILVRSIAKNIKNKKIDPAVLAIDDNGNFTISLLSGHLGRANDLTLKIAKLIDSQPVITTATDINNKIGIDSLSNKYYWDIINKNEILSFNKAILDEKTIKIFLNINKPHNINYKKDMLDFFKNNESNTLEIIDLKNKEMSIKSVDEKYILFKNNKNKDFNLNIINYNGIDFKKSDFDIFACFDKKYIFFKQRKLIVGIGARANIENEKVLNGIKIAMNNLNLPIERIDGIATAEIKSDEKGILETAKKLKIPLNIVSLDEIRDLNNPIISHSDFVREKFDIPGVAEPSSLIVAKKDSNSSKLIHRKMAIDGVTVAVAVSK
ncbi:Cobalt-precorrin-5A hydrolase [bioreactor metagenome]|uniref:Cobalt-precorrin-5A hydrolase n=1 Tax=bioreactor metagenome TaxID=1076179 RepID=A0A644TWB3_9ZZZZ|nr:cobalamin biosynthesis protein [Methanobrevibacter sp.]MEA4957078.1 cobalamin biosynthesis protein [Methanobrevibacter sp.]